MEGNKLPVVDNSINQNTHPQTNDNKPERQTNRKSGNRRSRVHGILNHRYWIAHQLAEYWKVIGNSKHKMKCMIAKISIFHGDWSNSLHKGDWSAKSHSNSQASDFTEIRIFITSRCNITITNGWPTQAEYEPWPFKLIHWSHCSSLTINTISKRKCTKISKIWNFKKATLIYFT